MSRSGAFIMATKIPIGLQLFSVRKDCETDFPHVLKEVARMGYAGVEFAGYHGRTAKELRKMLDDLGLVCCGTHTRMDTLTGDELAKTVEFNQILNNRYLICPVVEEDYRGTTEKWLKAAAFFNDVVERLHKIGGGMMTGYHNHHMEFTALPDGKYPWDLFFANTKSEVIMQLDTGNAMHAGVDVTPFLSRYPGRAITVHLKEYSAGRDKALVGQGQVKWADMFKLCESVGGTKWYIVEQESYAHPPLECVEICLKNLRAMGK
jgi:sugar phosphate isomerase/epimerase